MPALSWKTVATKLAVQLEVGHDYCDNHARTEDGLAEGCPFCADRDAVARFKAGKANARTAADWEALASIVAARMEYQDHCENRHKLNEGLAAQCPFCEDRKAIADYRKKAGQTKTAFERMTEGMTSVSVEEILRSARAEGRR